MPVGLAGASGLIGGGMFARLFRGRKVLRIGRRKECDLRADFAKPESMAGLGLNGLEAVVYCAGIVDEDFKANPAAAYLQNTVGFSAFVRRVVECGVPSFVYLSSAHVYGPLEGHVHERSPVNPLSDYALAHYAAEQILRRNCGTGRLQGLVLRPCAVFGMPESVETFDRWSLIPYSFPLEAVRDGVIVLRSSGEQRRNFISIDDLALYVEKYLDNRDDFVAFTIVNPVGPQTLSVYEFAQKCAAVASRLTGRECPVRRPASAASDGTADFAYLSDYPYHRSTDGVEDYLEAMIHHFLSSTASIR
jgi:UDP-glucose 4-epimerase